MLTVSWAERDPVAASDRGLAYGDGLFETLRVEHGRPQLLDLHLRRMASGAARLGIPVTDEELAQSVAQALTRYAQGAGRTDAWILKLVLTRGSGGRGYRPPVVCRPRLICSHHALPLPPPRTGVLAQLARQTMVVNPQLAGMKTLNRLEQVMASSELAEGVYEAILTDGSRRLVEGSRTNLIARYRGEWLVPPMATLAVKGVMLEHILNRLAAAGETVRQRILPFSLLSAPGFQGLHLTNSVIGAVPVRRIDCLHLPIDNALATICGPLTSSK